MISNKGLLEDEQGLSMGEMLTVKFCQPSHELMLTVYFGTPNIFITLWFGFD
jgi:hypothetical protein